jgi:hypothetical protein
MSRLADLARRAEGGRGSRIDFEESGRYLGIPPNTPCASVHDCPRNRVRYTYLTALATVMMVTPVSRDTGPT